MLKSGKEEEICTEITKIPNLPYSATDFQKLVKRKW